MHEITPQFSANAMTVLCKRYFQPKESNEPCSFCGKKHETPTELIERCSFGNEDYYNMLASLDFLPNSPTLFNGGTEQGTLSGCFKFNVQDSMVSILEVGRKAAMTLKYGGGTGYCLSEVRPYGKLIRSTHGRSCGPIAVLRYYHSIAQMITQGGKREGAQMAVLSCDHEDVRQFIHCKDEEPQSFGTFNLSVACTDEFMKLAKQGKNALFDEMCESAWKTGDPGIYFIDTSERTNPTPWLGKLDGTNACGEVPALDNEPCNLGSINLTHFAMPPTSNNDEPFDFNKLARTVRLATKYLDEIIDRNFYPDPVIEKAAKLTRKIGLGVMGWADTLALMHIHYDSQEAVDLGTKIMATIQGVSHDTSGKLGGALGGCPAFIAEKQEFAMRNAATTCIAPAGTISVLASCSSGIEPHFTLDGARSMGDGTRLEDGLRGLKTDFIPRTAHEIDWTWHVKHQAVFQEFTDLAVSKTINMKESATVKDFHDAFIYAWESGCKGVTIYRDKSRSSQIIVEKGEESHLFQGYTAAKRTGMTMGNAILAFEAYKTDKPGEKRRKLPKTRVGRIHKFDVGDIEGYLILGFFEDNTPGEIFINASKQGSTVQGLLHSLSIVTSMALQYGVPLEAIADKLQGQRFEPNGLTKNDKIPTATSIVDYIFRYMMLETQNHNGHSEHSGMICPDCGAPAIYEEGCLKCSKACGWSRCG